MRNPHTPPAVLLWGLLGSFIAGLLCTSVACAKLPDAVSHALQQENLSADSVSVFVQRVDASQPLISHHAERALSPASVMKLLMTYAGLELLGPAYRWRTEIYTDGTLSNGGVLNGNLIIKGYGDPDLMAEDFWRMLGNLRQAGVREIRGDLVLDSSYFAESHKDAGAFDGEPYRAYNALPNALLLNLKSTSFRLQPTPASEKATATAQSVSIWAEPDLPEIKIINHLRLAQTDCGDWKSRLSYDVQRQGNAVTVTFNGSYAVDCAEKYLELSLFDDAGYTYNLFRKLWGQLGGSFEGGLQAAPVAGSAVMLMQQDGQTLSDVVRRINKYSNNLMARQLLLTIAAERVALPGTEQNGAKAISSWLESKGLNFPELVIENGAGLSRVERISAQHLGALLLAAYASPVMPELMSSLPILAVDGTAMRRLKDSPMQGRAHLKTGSLDGVRSVAGYVLDQKSRRWVVVFMINNARAANSRAAQDALLDWVYQQP